ncbi:MAG: T9SS type A sorting domain-containing protein [Bacteroidales bacterium]|nr:T9SS type A sorting domain-containing protein [Bacteroidales bacterium]MBN2818599.1 T9SS type A sorting domain-containing protein [Bacteroidales bacterium]
MKKYYYTVIAIILSVFCFSKSLLSQHAVPIRAENCHAVATSAPFLDGIADEACWGSESALTEMFNASGYDGDNSDFSGYIKFCWDYTNLYIFADITDDVAINFDSGSSNTYEQDNFEVFIDIDTTIVNADGAYIHDESQLRYNRGYDEYTGSSARNDASFEYFVQVDGAGNWQVEAAIPWLAIMPDGTLQEDVHDILMINGGTIGFDAQFADNDTEVGSNRDAQLAWDADTEGADATEDNAWKDTRVFGVLNLVGTPNPSPSNPTNPTNTAPVANAGNDTTVFPRDIIQLHGSSSYDNEDDYLYYIWSSLDNIQLYYESDANPTVKIPFIASDDIFKFVLRVYDGQYYSDPDTVSISVNGYNSIDLVDVSQFDIFPNPCKGILNINSEIAIQNIEILSIAGKLLCSESFDTKTVQYNVSHLASGTYVLKIQAEEGAFCKKIIIE